ncbi:hypothetical protein GQ42DRAFT_23046 [Ramicandelaber brevisporus]|nr:hypothetical protein GQ42DRAFT_23046 [Ramicandelaber brevisporus]
MSATADILTPTLRIHLADTPSTLPTLHPTIHPTLHPATATATATASRAALCCAGPCRGRSRTRTLVAYITARSAHPLASGCLCDIHFSRLHFPLHFQLHFPLNCPLRSIVPSFTRCSTAPLAEPGPEATFTPQREQTALAHSLFIHPQSSRHPFAISLCLY